jgi:hypothetical protein
MALPKLETPSYNAVIPSTQKRVSFRPYLVKEEKVLLIALESGDNDQILSAMKEIISACTSGKFEPNGAPLFDLEYLFLQIRSKSVGEVSRVGIKCEKCEKSTEVDIVLEEAKVMSNGSTTIPSNKIKLTDKIGLTMRYPSMDTLLKVEKATKNNVDATIEVLADCIDSIYDEKKIYKASDTPREELVDFIGNLNQAQFLRVNEFLENMPRLEQNVEFDCAHCKHHNQYTLSGLQSFFD